MELTFRLLSRSLSRSLFQLSEISYHRNFVGGKREKEKALEINDKSYKNKLKSFKIVQQIHRQWEIPLHFE